MLIDFIQSFVLLLRKDYRQRQIRCKHAAGIVAAEWNHGYGVMRSEMLIYVLAEGFAASEPRGALSHRRAGAVKASQG